MTVDDREVLDLVERGCLNIGGLDNRVVTTEWSGIRRRRGLVGLRMNEPDKLAETVAAMYHEQTALILDDAPLPIGELWAKGGDA